MGRQIQILNFDLRFKYMFITIFKTINLYEFSFLTIRDRSLLAFFYDSKDKDIYIDFLFLQL